MWLFNNSIHQAILWFEDLTLYYVRRGKDIIGPSVLRAPAEQTKVATVLGN